LDLFLKKQISLDYKTYMVG